MSRFSSMLRPPGPSPPPPPTSNAPPPHHLPQRLELFLYGANFVERVTLREREYHLLALFRRELREDVLLESADHHQPRDDGEEFVGVDDPCHPNLAPEQYRCANSVNLVKTFGRSASTWE